MKSNVLRLSSSAAFVAFCFLALSGCGATDPDSAAAGPGVENPAAAAPGSIVPAVGGPGGNGGGVSGGGAASGANH